MLQTFYTQEIYQMGASVWQILSVALSIDMLLLLNLVLPNNKDSHERSSGLCFLFDVDRHIAVYTLSGTLVRIDTDDTES